MLCYKCNKELPRNARFCNQCGAKVEAAESPVSYALTGTVLRSEGAELLKEWTALLPEVIKVKLAKYAKLRPYIDKGEQ